METYVTDESSGNAVLAIVDGFEGAPVVWWVNLGPRITGMSRLCGAWVLDAADSAPTLQTLTVSRMTLATASGWSLLNEHEIVCDEALNIEATRDAVLGIRDELQSAYEHAVATRKNGRALTPLRWPAMPGPLDVETAETSVGDPRAARALALARWFNDLCVAWEAVEEQRLSRSYLRSLGGPSARVLPVVLQAARPGLAA
ncbi:hypothetical protein [Pseudonocardia sp. T1-2H]|uniref:hypothetical protein n=1 Tax=Pseudonocardia sp. T1-2H TaxID=3128899 RepID=UPI0031010DA0